MAENRNQSRTATRFRKKPVVIEAMLFDGSEASMDALANWSNGAVVHSVSSGALLIDTLEGTLVVTPDDWVIRGHI